MSNVAFTKLMMGSQISNLMDMTDSQHREKFNQEFYENPKECEEKTVRVVNYNDLETSIKILKKEIGSPSVDFLIKNCPNFTTSVEINSLLRRDQTSESSEQEQEEFVNISKKIVSHLGDILDKYFKTQIYTEDSIYIDLLTNQVCDSVGPNICISAITLERFKNVGSRFFNCNCFDSRMS